MSRYTSQITFLYYQDFTYGEHIMTTILDLPIIMDQGFAKIYLVGEDSFLGIVETNKESNPGHTLVSLNTTTVQAEYERIKKYDINNLTEIIYHKEIPLYSFFFEDKEGHRFEIQMFEKEEDQSIF